MNFKIFKDKLIKKKVKSVSVEPINSQDSVPKPQENSSTIGNSVNEQKFNDDGDEMNLVNLLVLQRLILLPF